MIVDLDKPLFHFTILFARMSRPFLFCYPNAYWSSFFSFLFTIMRAVADDSIRDTWFSFSRVSRIGSSAHYGVLRSGPSYMYYIPRSSGSYLLFMSVGRSCRLTFLTVSSSVLSAERALRTATYNFLRSIPFSTQQHRLVWSFSSPHLHVTGSRSARSSFGRLHPISDPPWILITLFELHQVSINTTSLISRY
jgi:hypothetical protein